MFGTKFIKGGILVTGIISFITLCSFWGVVFDGESQLKPAVEKLDGFVENVQTELNDVNALVPVIYNFIGNTTDEFNEIRADFDEMNTKVDEFDKKFTSFVILVEAYISRCGCNSK